jgi:hypothetical protein
MVGPKNDEAVVIERMTDGNVDSDKMRDYDRIGRQLIKGLQHLFAPSLKWEVKLWPTALHHRFEPVRTSCSSGIWRGDLADPGLYSGGRVPHSFDRSGSLPGSLQRAYHNRQRTDRSQLRRDRLSLAVADVIEPRVGTLAPNGRCLAMAHQKQPYHLPLPHKFIRNLSIHAPLLHQKLAAFSPIESRRASAHIGTIKLAR